MCNFDCIFYGKCGKKTDCKDCDYIYDCNKCTGNHCEDKQDYEDESEPKKSDGVKDVFKWLKKKCKEQKQEVIKAQNEFEEAKKQWSGFDDTQCIIDGAEINLARAEERLRAYVDIKIGVEKYMKKLKHQGE